MFQKLLAQFQKKETVHPLGSEENLAATVEEIATADPARTLFDTDDWLDDIGRFQGEIGLQSVVRALLRFDGIAAGARTELLARYLDPKHREYQSDLILGTLEKNLTLVQQASHHCLQAAAGQTAEIERGTLCLAAMRGLHAWAEHKKLQHFRYHAPDAGSWQRAREILTLAAKAGFASESMPIYDDDGDKRSPLQLYLCGAYFELAPLANLVPHQMELLHRLLLRVAPSLELSSKPGAATTHVIDLGGSSGPQPYRAGTPAGERCRYLSCRRLNPHIIRLAGELKDRATLPEWIAATRCLPEQARQLVMALLQHWTEAAPQRSADRQALDEPLLVVHGFTSARRMIACSHFARLGQSVEYEGTQLDALFDAYRFGRVDEPDRAPVVDSDGELPRIVHPLEVLEKLELSGDRLMMERWQQVDASPSGVGALVPALRNKHRTGELVCMRFADGLEWHMGIVRRITRNADGKSLIGMESLRWPSLSALIKPQSGVKPSAWAEHFEHGGHGYADAIWVVEGGDELILPRDMFVADLPCELKSSIGRRAVRLLELLDRGSDYDRIRINFTE